MATDIGTCNQLVMSCIGVLYSSRANQNPNPSDKVMADFQLNYWKLPKRFWEYNRFLDLGLLVYDAKDIDSILFYLPFQLEDNQLEDLGSILANDNLLSILFSDSFRVEDDSRIIGYRYASSNGEKKQAFWIACLTSTDFKIHPLKHGTLVEVMIKTKPNVKKEIKNADEGKTNNYNLYLRFRVKNLQEKSLSYIESVSNDFFQSVFSRTEMMNLHINAVGEIDEEDNKDLVSKYSFLAFNKVHFFFIGSSEEETISGTTNYTDSRLLDSKKWTPYIGNNNPQNRKCLAYHWRKTGPMENCNIFIRTVYSSANIWKIVKYSLIVIILGAMGSLLASFFTPGCKCELEQFNDSTVVVSCR